MTDKKLTEVIASATRALDSDEQGLVDRLPVELGNAFALVAAARRTAEPVRCFTQALGQLRVAGLMGRVESTGRLAFLLELAGYLNRLSAGRDREVLAAIGAIGTARTVAEARNQRTLAELGIALRIGELAQEVAAAA